MEKNIKSSRRGLTFSFLPTGRLDIGSHYDYIIANGSIRIVSNRAIQGFPQEREVQQLDPAH